MAYATAQDVATYIGRSLTSPQLQQADLAVQAASAWIDDYTGKSWSPSSPTTELHTLTNGQLLYLQNKPITAITQVRIRPSYVAGGYTTMTAGIGYELLDASKGIVSFNIAGYPGYIIEITYTHTASVPYNVKMAAIMLAAQILNNSLNPMQQRIKSMNDNRAISVTFKNDQVSPQIKDLLPRKAVYIV